MKKGCAEFLFLGPRPASTGALELHKEGAHLCALISALLSAPNGKALERDWAVIST